MPEWTPTQRQAIDAQNPALLVAASAGSGKTAVLVERMVTRIRAGVSLEHMLVVTFTKAATAEMRGRILQVLQDAAESGEPHLVAQALRVERASIYTLHGFCTEVLRQHFQAVGIDPSFRIADGAEMEALRAQAMDAALLACYERPSAAFDTLSNALTPAQILQWAAYVERFMMARPDPWTWLAQSVDALRVTPEEISTCTWMRTILQFVALDAQGACNQFEQLAQICAQTEGLVRYRETAQADVKMARTIIQSAEEGYDALQACTLCFARRPAKKKDEDPNLLALFDQYRDRGKKLLKNAIHAAWLFRPVQEHALDLEDAHTLLSGVVDVLKAFAKRFEAMKREKNLLSFQDLEHLALHALQTPYVAAYYHRKYEYVFVDEYQDSSALQEAILQCFVPGNHFFMVGDVKQSIYRFRLADPMLFLSKYTSYATDAQAEARRIDLNANFRSSPMVLAAVNDLFRDIMRADITEIAYDADAMLYPGRVFASEQPRVELHLLADNLTDADEAEAEDESASDFEVITSDLPAVEEEEEGIEGDDRLVYEAEVIAERIYALQAQKATGLNGEPLRLSDMVILLRATTRRVTPILETLQRHGIPAWADGGDGYFEQLEIRQMIDLLSVIDNPYQDLPFLSALRGPALGLHEEELAEIRIEQPDGDFYAATCQRAKRQDPLGISLQAFFARLERWRFLSRIVPLSIFVQEVFQEMDLYATAGALPNGRARQMNLRRLVMRAGRFERQQMGGLSKFLRHLTRIRQGESMAAHELGDAEEIVRIMSIHKSKGLQFPVVFVAGLGNSFNQRVKSAPLLAHSALGIGAMAYDPEVPARYQTLARRAIALRTYQEQLAEETRILYVAMTRAEKYLILVGCGDALEKDCMRWSFPISAASVYQARHMLDWVAHSLMHRPAGNVLREIAQLPRLPEDPNDPWQVILHPRRAASFPTAQTPRAPQSMPTETLMEELDAMWQWDPATCVHVQLKQSVTEQLRHRPREMERVSDLPELPAFMMETTLTGAERGTALHAWMHCMDLEPLRVCSPEGMGAVLQADLARVTAIGVLAAEAAETIDVAQVTAFWQSSLGARALRAKELHREWPFNLRSEDQGQRILVQGVIDCCFVEEGAWILIDYKTDHVEAVPQTLAQHAPQLAYYAEALRKITRLPVREKIVYLFATGRAYTL